MTKTPVNNHQGFYSGGLLVSRGASTCSEVLLTKKEVAGAEVMSRNSELPASLTSPLHMELCLFQYKAA